MSNRITDYKGHGLEYEWIAVDRDGHIACFTNGGIASIPQFLETNKELYEDVVVDLISYLCEERPSLERR